jgi:uncharacterized protein
MASDVPLFEGPDFGPADEEVEGVEEELEPELELEEESADDEGNRVSGGTARAVLEHVARSIVEDPDAVFIDSAPARNGLRFELHVAPADMGRIIGKRGRVAQALRALVRAAAAKDGTDASVDIVD